MQAANLKQAARHTEEVEELLLAEHRRLEKGRKELENQVNLDI